MKTQEFPILEFDDTPEAMIEPTQMTKPGDVPERCVLCFFNDVIQMIAGSDAVKTEIVHHIGSEIGRVPVYIIEHEGSAVYSGASWALGAPLAAAFSGRGVCALGCRANSSLVVGPEC